MDFDALFAQVLEVLQREQRISYRALRRRFDLSDDDLEDLKVELIEAKRLAADENDRILVWAGGTGAGQPAREPLSYTPPHLAEKILTSRHALEGERKQVTVLFADIKDSTELIKDLDPEAAQQLLDPAIHLMMDAVHRFEGTVNQVLGDGIMALFGAPIAHEDHAARACYAALAMQAAMRDYTEEVRRRDGLEMRLRVGLNAGEVVVRTIGNDLHMDYSAVGPTTHLAARMEQMATPGTIRLTAATLRLVEGLVHVNTLGPIPIKGMTEPVDVYELTGASTIKRRLQAAVARGLTRFVGRDVEIAALNHALDQAGKGHGQIVATVGEAGVGKSRLVYEFIQSHRTQGWLILESAGVSYGKATPYFPVVHLLKHYIHVEEGDDARTMRAKVTGQIVTLDETLQDTIPTLLSLLDALPEDSPFLQLDPPQRRQRTLDGLKRLLLRESQVQPLLLVFEDLHWIDSETQALLDSLVESLPTARLLLLVNYRPEHTHGWGSKAYYAQLRLDPLAPESAEAFLAVLLGDDPSLEPLKQRLIARTEGNPFFLEESVRTLVETQVLAGAPGTYRLLQELPTVQVPATVQAILAARIDRLPADHKRLLQTAAVIGNEVPFGLLQAIAEMPVDALHRGLAHLQAAEFLYQTHLFPEAVYTFKHALTHDVAYGGLLQERRRVLHTRIVEQLEGLYADRLDEQVERLAHHALRGEVWDKALAYCRQAGAKAAARSGYREAVASFEQALMVVKHLPKSLEILRQTFELRMELTRRLVPLADYGRILEHLREAQAIAEAQSDPRRLGLVCSHMSDYFRLTGDSEHAVVYGERALAFATELEDFPLRVLANQRLGIACYAVGDYWRAVELLKQNVESLQGELIRERFGAGSLPSVLSRSYIVFPLVDLGKFAEAVSIGAEGVQIADASDTTHSQVLAVHSVGFAYLCKGEFYRAIPILDRALLRCQVEQISLDTRVLAATLGYAYALAGRMANAVPLLEQALRQSETLKVLFRYAVWLTWLGEAHLLAGHLEEAQTLTKQALALARERQERGNQAYAFRLLGEIAMHRDPPDIDHAETHYRQALTLAEELGMRPLQAHCHHGLGKLYRHIGRVEPARAELSAAIDLYRSMDMSFWLPEAEATLAQVEGQ